MRIGTKIIIGLMILLTISSSLIAQEAEDTTLTYDQEATGTISNDNYETLYTFTGAEGDIVVITMLALPDTSLDSYLTLRDANGEELTNDDDSAGDFNARIGPYTLPYDGQYTIVASRYEGSRGFSEGDFTLSLTTRMPNIIELDELVIAQIADPAEFESYTFTPTQTGTYRLEYLLAEGDGSAVISVEDADENYLASAALYPDERSFTVTQLTANEPISLTVNAYNYNYDTGEQSSDPSEIRFSLTYVEPNPITVTVEQSATLTGVLADGQAVDFYSFDAETGQTLDVLGNATGGDLNVYFVQPNGIIGLYGSTAYEEENESLTSPRILTQTGTYIAVFYRDNSDATSLGYNVTIELRETNQLILGESQDGTISYSDNYEDAYVYQGTTGETLTVTLESRSDTYAIGLIIEGNVSTDAYEPENVYVNLTSSIGGSVSYTFTLPHDGTYIFYVSNGDYYSDETGDYRIRIDSN